MLGHVEKFENSVQRLYLPHTPYHHQSIMPEYLHIFVEKLLNFIISSKIFDQLKFFYLRDDLQTKKKKKLIIRLQLLKKRSFRVTNSKPPSIIFQL